MTPLIPQDFLDLMFSGSYYIFYAAVRSALSRQDAPTLSSEIVQMSDVSGTTYNSAYVSDVQNLILIKKVPCNNFRQNFLDTR